MTDPQPIGFSDILYFWFNEISEQQWWAKDKDFDLMIRQRFSTLHASACDAELYDWRHTAAGRLAEILVLDQFSRNLYRDDPRAFSNDSMALALAQEAVSQGLDSELTAVQRTFLYMPYMHSESLQIHDLAVDLYERNGLQSNLDFELKHREIIERFGRYPHRNKIIGRESSKQELEFLQTPGSSF